MSSEPLNTATPMLREFLGDGLGHHCPVFRGKQLAEECGDFSASVKNIQTMLDAGLKILDVRADGRGRKLLISFDSGEQYLATGFAYGSDMQANDEHKAKVFALAKSLAKWRGGSVESWLHQITFEESPFYKGSLELFHDEPDHDGNDDYAPRLYVDAEV